MEDYFSYPFYYYQDETSFDKNDNENEELFMYQHQYSNFDNPVMNLSKPFENGLMPYASINVNDVDAINSTYNLISTYPTDPVISKIPLPDLPDMSLDSAEKNEPLPRYIPYTMDSMTDMYNMDKTNYIDDMYNIDKMNKIDVPVMYSKPAINEQPMFDNSPSPETRGATKSPFVSNNSEKIDVSLYKELNAYKNVGSPNGKSDFLYTGTYGSWTFAVPPEILNLKPKKTEIIIKAVLDDHRSIPTSKYSATIVANGVAVHSGKLPLEHATPSGGTYRNWTKLIFKMPKLGASNKITIRNTSMTRKIDWIAFIWMELRIYQ